VFPEKKQSGKRKVVKSAVQHSNIILIGTKSQTYVNLVLPEKKQNGK
jgi:hypothetical protein